MRRSAPVSPSVAGTAAAVPGPEATQQRPIRTDNHNDPDLHLLVDDEEIEQIENLRRVLNRPQKHPAPVLVADQPWEGERAQAWGSVIVEPDGRLRIWYLAFSSGQGPDEQDRGGYAYAESSDGIHWQKPSLGTIAFRGSTANNLFYTCAPDGKHLGGVELARRGIGLPALDESGRTIGVLNNLDGLTVVRDDEDPDPMRRYKLIANMQDHRMWAPYYKERYPDVTDEQVKQARAIFGQYLDCSPDGIHWTRRPRHLLGAVGDYMMVTRDHRNGQWWLNERARGRGGRNAALRAGPDLLNWSQPEIVFDNGPDSENGRLWEWHGGITPFNYGNLNLGLLEKWPKSDFGATCELVCQRDGKPWVRVSPGTPFLDVGPEGAFDRVLIYPTHNAPIRIDDRLYLFYTGGGARTDPHRAIPMAIGLATIGLDRFAALASWRSGVPGRVVTTPMKVTGSRLAVNVESFELAPIRVAVSTPEGEFLPGYGFDDSRVECEAQRIYTPVGWQAKADLGELRGTWVKLHFEICGAALYSYRFSESSEG